MALNEDKILKGRFVFISYSHKDNEAVQEDVSALLARGVRVWHDINMRKGSNWKEVASAILHHENCAGVIFYNSPNAFISDAVQQEQKLVRDLGLKYWFVNLEGKMSTTILGETVIHMSKKYGFEDQACAVYMNSVMPQQQKMFSNDHLCFMRSSSSQVVQEIFQEVAEKNKLIDNEDNFLSNQNSVSGPSEEAGDIVLGRYITGDYIGPEQASDTLDQRFGQKNDLIQMNGKRYRTSDLCWKLLYVENGEAVLLCSRIIRQSSYNAGEAFLKEGFAKLAFTAEEQARLGGIRARYMTEEDVAKCTRPDALRLSEIPNLKHWWIDANGLTVGWKQTYSNHIPYPTGFSCLIKKGIRPVITVSAEPIQSK